MKLTATTGLSHRSADVPVRSKEMPEHGGVCEMLGRFGDCESCQSGPSLRRLRRGKRGPVCRAGTGRRPRSGINALPLSAFRFALSPIDFKSPPSSHVVFTSDFPATFSRLFVPFCGHPLRVHSRSFVVAFRVFRGLTLTN